MTTAKDSIEQGDKFIKVDDPRIIWIVERTIDVPHSVPHVQLVREGQRNRRITLSKAVLLDGKLHKRVS